MVRMPFRFNSSRKESYTVSKEDILTRVTFAKANYDIKQVLFQGGHNPKLNTEYFEDIFRTLKTKCPDVAIHGLSASEVDMIARVDRTSPLEVLERLQKAGLESLPGAGAEILRYFARIRTLVSRRKEREFC